jgi:hypothetical protein
MAETRTHGERLPNDGSWPHPESREGLRSSISYVSWPLAARKKTLVGPKSAA